MKIGRSRKRKQAPSWPELTLEKRTKFLGTALIDLGRLEFIRAPGRKDLEQEKKWLISVFQNDGCNPLLVEHHIPAIIEHDILQGALSNSNARSDELLSDQAARWPKLTLPNDVNIACLQGRLRVEVAKSFLPLERRWWAVDLYRSDISHALRRALEDQVALEWHDRGGEICFNILKEELLEWNRGGTSWWSRLQSQDQRDELERLLKKDNITAALFPLLEIPALAPGFRGGMVGSALRSKCDEEIIHYLDHMYRFWCKLLGDEPTSKAKLDAFTVQELQLRNPAEVKADRDYLEAKCQSGEIFGGFNVSERKVIFDRLLSLPCLVPSFDTFFEDLKFLIDVAYCVKRLVKPAVGQTISEALEDAFSSERVAPCPDVIDRSEYDQYARSHETQFQISRRKLWLFAMRELGHLSPDSIRKGRALETPMVQVKLHVWYRFALIANKLGFDSLLIQKELSKNPDRQTARDQFLLARDRESFSYSDADLERYIDEIVLVYEQAPQSEAQLQSSALICSTGGENLKDRCGFPDWPAYSQCVRSLSFDNVHRNEPSESGGLTPLYVRRAVYLCFFGSLKSPRETSGTQESNVTKPDMPQQHGDFPNDDHNASPAIPVVSDFGPSLGTLVSTHMPRDDAMNEVPSRAIPIDIDVCSNIEHQQTAMVDLVPNPYTPSNYSPSQVSNDTISITANQPSYLEYDETSVITLKHFRSGQWHSEGVYDSGTGDGTMTQLISRYIRQGLLPLSTSMRSLAVPQCREVALRDPERTILIMSKADYRLHLSSKLQSTRPTTQKRTATEEIDHDQRPYKRTAQHEERQLDVIKRPVKRPASNDFLKGQPRRKWRAGE